MADHRDRGGFRVQAQLEVACVVGGPSVLPRDVAVIADRVPGQRLLTDVAGGARLSYRVMCIACGLASTALILRSSRMSASKKCSAAFGQRYTTGASVCPSHRTTI